MSPVRLDAAEAKIWAKMQGQAVGPRSNVWKPTVIRRSPKQHSSKANADAESERSSEEDIESGRDGDTSTVVEHAASKQCTSKPDSTPDRDVLFLTRVQELERVVNDLETQLRETKSALKDSDAKLEAALADASRVKEENAKLKVDVAGLKLAVKRADGLSAVQVPVPGPGQVKVPKLVLRTAQFPTKALSARAASTSSESKSGALQQSARKGVKLAISPRRKLQLSPRRSPRRDLKRATLPKGKAEAKLNNSVLAASPRQYAESTACDPRALDSAVPTAPASEQALHPAKSPSPYKSKEGGPGTSRLYSPTTASLSRKNATQTRSRGA
jgi:hypothetical protein